MRRILMATLLLSPGLLHAQANQPAQPQAANASTLQSSLRQPVLLHAAAKNAAPDASTRTVRVSTGVVAPKLIHTVAIESDPNSVWDRMHLDRTVVVGMTVDAQGKPEDLKILESAGAVMDSSVLEAVSQYRFTPGTVSNQVTDVPVRLAIVVQNPVQ